MTGDDDRGQAAAPPATPPGVAVRPASVPDAPAVAACQAACWREAYAGMVPTGFFEAYPEGMGTDRWREVLAAPEPVVAVAEDATGTVVGFCYVAPARPPSDGTPPPSTWQLRAIYLRARLHGVGVADRLLEATLGHRPAHLWVFRDNPRAIAFYRRHGFVPDGAEQVDERWTGLPELRMVRS